MKRVQIEYKVTVLVDVDDSKVVFPTLYAENRVIINADAFSKPGEAELMIVNNDVELVDSCEVTNEYCGIWNEESLISLSIVSGGILKRERTRGDGNSRSIPD